MAPGFAVRVYIVHSAVSPFGMDSTHIHSDAVSVTVGVDGLDNQETKITIRAKPEVARQRVMNLFISRSPEWFSFQLLE